MNEEREKQCSRDSSITKLLSIGINDRINKTENNVTDTENKLLERGIKGSRYGMELNNPRNT